MSRLELNYQVRDLLRTYLEKKLSPETSLEIASDFVLDLINTFGDGLGASLTLKLEWKPFAPFEFILGLNEVLKRYKEGGYPKLTETERTLLHDNKVFLGSLVKAALAAHPDAFPEEDHFQVPNAVATELLVLLD